ncbi:lipopolysaccharide transport periplasmic protein LptA [Salinisphaera sp. Q1T1-3]|uniref:lipopolysaccharide transport periplasmic protein LptA n=1 Tax=Salinisphaera sp. Q1T1-3 TaxID=2321229 RepID=UPI0013143C9E|nr:lipopolysaccharide transport periplasmic protein LptA [Salinisphaera sp. Q1T1-3]
MLRKTSLTLVATLALCTLAAGNATAADAGSRQLPIQIQSDNADFAQKSGVSTYTGDVVLTRGGMTLTGSKLVVTRINDRGNIKAVLTGSPAHIDKKPDAENNETVTGHASSITYTNSNAELTLRGNAVLERSGGDTINSPVITRNVDSGVTHAQGGGQDGQRVHITIQPNQDNP